MELARGAATAPATGWWSAARLVQRQPAESDLDRAVVQLLLVFVVVQSCVGNLPFFANICSCLLHRCEQHDQGSSFRAPQRYENQSASSPSPSSSSSSSSSSSPSSSSSSKTSNAAPGRPRTPSLSPYEVLIDHFESVFAG